MKSKMVVTVTAAAVLVVLVAYAPGQRGEPRQAPWLEPKNPTRLEWLVLQWQANEGDTEFGENGVTVNFYLDRDSDRTGEIRCDLDYLPSTEARVVQIIEDGILRRFERQRQIDPWARVKIIKKVAPG